MAIDGDRAEPIRATIQALVGAVEFGSPDPTLNADDDFAAVDFGDGATRDQPIDVEGPFIDDGTLVKPVAVDTTVPDGSELVRTIHGRRWRHARRDRLEVRRLDDVGLVGERPEVEVRQGRPDAADPARDRVSS